MVRLYALGGQMRLVSSRPVVEAAAGVADEILETYPVPNRNLEELRDLARRGVVKNLLDGLQRSVSSRSRGPRHVSAL